jgi:hypothetical protein
MAKRLTVQDARKLIKEADDSGQKEWRQKAYSDLMMYNGYQYPDEDLNKMRAEKRPPVVYNRVAPLVDAVVGYEINNRRAVKFYPQQRHTAPMNSDVMNSVSEWVRATSHQEFEETQAAKYLFITGLGATATRMAYEDTEEGRLDVECVHPLNVRWDSKSRQRNAVDADWVARYKIMKREDVIDIFNLDEEKAAQLPSEDGQNVKEFDIVKKRAVYPPKITDDESQDTSKERIKGMKVWQFQYRVTEYKFRTTNPFLQLDPAFFEFVAQDLMGIFGQDVQVENLLLTQEQLRKLEKMARELGLPKPESLRVPKKRYYQMFFVNDIELSHTETPASSCFTIKLMTGKRDEKHNCWYGVVRPASDPQLYANKLFSTILYTFMTNSKGGLFMEEGATSDVMAFKREYAKPDGVCMLNPGGLGKLQEKAKDGVSPAAAEIMKYSIDALPQVAGISPEALGVGSTARSNNLAQTRIQQTYTQLAEYFDAITQYRQDWGRMLIEFTREYLADGRMIRLTNAPASSITLLSDMLADDYDVLIEDAPVTQTQKMEVWQLLSQMFAGQGVPPPLYKYSPLPQEVVTEVMQFFEQAQQPTPEQQAMTAIEIELAQAKAKKDAALAENAMARTRKVDSETTKRRIENASELINLYSPDINYEGNVI